MNTHEKQPAEQVRERRAGRSDGTAADRTEVPSVDSAGLTAVGRLLHGGGPVTPPMVAGVAAVAGNAAATSLARGATVRRAALTAQGAGPLHPRIAEAIDAERGRGSPLPDPVRTDMEQHLGADLSAVRVHTGSAADTLNRAVTAEAFTTGTDVFFGAGRYDPTSSAGRELLAHELTHAAQPDDLGTGARVSSEDDPAEVQARDVARRVAHSTEAPRDEPEAAPAREAAGSPVVGHAVVARSPEATGAGASHPLTDPSTTGADALAEAERQAVHDVEVGGFRLPDLERRLLGEWSSTEQRRRYTRRFLLTHWDHYLGGAMDPDELDMQMLHYEKLVVGRMSPDRAEGELASAGWMAEALEGPEQRAGKRARLIAHVEDMERGREAEQRNREAVRQLGLAARRAPGTMPDVPAHPDAFPGIRTYFLVDGLRDDVVASFAVKKEPYLVAPHFDLTTPEPTVVYYIAFNSAAKRNEWVVGPDSVHAFLNDAGGYERMSRLYYQLTPNGSQPAPHVVEAMRMTEAAMRGELGEAVSALGASWEEALKDPGWVLNAAALTATGATMGSRQGGSGGSVRRPDYGTSAPPIALGEIKPIASYGPGLRQLSSRGNVAGNTALVTFDNQGVVNMQVFAETAGVRRIIWEQRIGTVPVPPGITPGTRAFGDAMEPAVRGLVERATGQRFLVKPSSGGGAAHGPDLVPVGG